MAKKVFFSFHYEPDNWRASQVRNMGVIEGNPAVSDNDWEEVTQGGASAIEKWIDEQLNGRSCTIVLIGSNTAGRKWIKYEIEKSWNSGKGLLGIYVHNLKDRGENQSSMGNNPFDDFTVNNGKEQLSDIVKAYNPPYTESKNVYSYIHDNIDKWIDEAIEIRNK